MSRVLLASPYFPPKIGGVERYAHRLAVGLRNRCGHDVSVVTTSPAGGYGATSGAAPDGLRVTTVPARFRVSATPLDPRWFSILRRVMADERPDVIVTHAPVPGLADVCLAVRGRTPAIATYHSGSLRKHAGPVDAAIVGYEAAVLPRLLRRAEAVVTTFPGRAAGGIPSRFVPPGVDTAVFRPALPGTRDEGLILYAGRIEHASQWKGIGTLLEAFRSVAGSFPSARLELAGGGDAVDHYRSLAGRLGVGDRVTFSGPMSAPELAEAYRRAALVVLPSETDAEAFGMVLIEAMACGTPVVASRIGGMPAVIADTGGGLLAEPRDSRSLAGTMGRLLADPELRRRLGHAGLARVRERYRWDSVVDAFEELIGELTAAPRAEGRPGSTRRGDHVGRRAG